MIEFVYLVQIIALLACIYMTWKVRRIINGLSASLILLFIFLIIRRVDDVFSILSTEELAFLSSAIVALITFSIWQIYKGRDVYALYFRNRQERVKQYDEMSKNDIPVESRAH